MTPSPETELVRRTIDGSLEGDSLLNEAEDLLFQWLSEQGHYARATVADALMHRIETDGAQIQSLSRQVAQLEADQFTIASNANRLNDEKNALSRQVERLREALEDAKRWLPHPSKLVETSALHGVWERIEAALTDKGTETPEPNMSKPKRLHEMTATEAAHVFDTLDRVHMGNLTPGHSITAPSSPSLPATPAKGDYDRLMAKLVGALHNARKRIKVDKWEGAEGFWKGYIKCLQDCIDEEDAFRAFIAPILPAKGAIREALEGVDQIERLAFAIPPPNAHTPQIVSACIQLRAVIRSALQQGEGTDTRIQATPEMVEAATDVIAAGLEEVADDPLKRVVEAALNAALAVSGWDGGGKDAVTPRFELRVGKFGHYFHDTQRGGPKGFDMPLEHVLEKLNRMEEYTQRLAERSRRQRSPNPKRGE